jgi:hypothetical protein
MMALRQNRKRTEIGAEELSTALALRQEKFDARESKRQRGLDDKREKEERSLIENNRALQEQLDLEAAQLLQERTVEKATVKAFKQTQKKQQKRGLEVAKEIKKRKEKATLEFSKLLADLEKQQEVPDANNDIFPKESRPRNGRIEFPHRNLFTNLSK